MIETVITELDKWADVCEEAATIKEFLTNQSSKAMLCKVYPEHQFNQYMPILESEISELIYDYFDIDSQKLELERRQLLKEVTTIV